MLPKKGLFGEKLSKIVENYENGGSLCESESKKGVNGCERVEKRGSMCSRLHHQISGSAPPPIGIQVRFSLYGSPLKS